MDKNYVIHVQYQEKILNKYKIADAFIAFEVACYLFKRNFKRLVHRKRRLSVTPLAFAVIISASQSLVSARR